MRSEVRETSYFRSVNVVENRRKVLEMSGSRILWTLWMK